MESQGKSGCSRLKWIEIVWAVIPLTWVNAHALQCLHGTTIYILTRILQILPNHTCFLHSVLEPTSNRPLLLTNFSARVKHSGTMEIILSLTLISASGGSPPTQYFNLWISIKYDCCRISLYLSFGSLLYLTIALHFVITPVAWIWLICCSQYQSPNFSWSVSYL